MYFKRGCSYFWKLKPNFIKKKSNIINKIRCILNGNVRISENWNPTLLIKSYIINKIRCILNMNVLISEN
jgi:hypothetical protein